MKVRLLLFVFCVFNAGCSHNSSGESVRIQLTNASLEVPRANLAAGGEPSWMDFLTGKPQSTLVNFPAEQISQAIPEYPVFGADPRGDVIATISSIDVEEQRRYRSPARLHDLWNAVGSYKGRVIESDPHLTDVYRVYRRIEYPYSWAVLSVNPLDGKGSPASVDYLVAYCLRLEARDPTGDRVVSCNSSLTTDGLAIDFHFPGEAIANTQSIKAFLRTTVSSWKVN